MSRPLSLGLWLGLFLAVALAASPKTLDLECMFLGYPDLEYDGYDRTEPLTDKNFNRTVFAEDAKSVVFFNDVEDDDAEFDQYECFLQVRACSLKFDPKLKVQLTFYL